jgi:hypothetical protein
VIGQLGDRGINVVYTFVVPLQTLALLLLGRLKLNLLNLKRFENKEDKSKM